LAGTLAAVGWGVVGLAVGVGVRAASVWLARAEGLEAGRRAWQRFGPVVLSGLLFGLFAWRIGAVPLLLVRSLWLAVLVQVIFFDLEHQLILDRVLLPAAVAALALSLFTPALGIVAALLTGAVTGIAFLALALAGTVLFKAEAMGLGDVKFGVFMGLVLGPRPTLSALVLGFFLAGVVAATLVVLRLRTMRDSIPYGPFLAAGAVAALFALGST
jgi:prepilin signal peptidase PulO-like enzyme (type II secretory pathway)